MENTNPTNPFPGDVIKQELEKRGWTHEDLSKILGRPRPVITNIILGKTVITPTTAQELSVALGGTADYWLKLESDYQLSQSIDDTGMIRERAKLYEFAPLKEMQRRGWITSTDDFEDIEKQLCDFFHVSSVDESPKLEVAMRTSKTHTNEATRAQITWCYRCLYLASALLVKQYDPDMVRKAIPDLRKLATRQEWVKEIPRFLTELGIRFVVVEQLPKTKIDGAALWMNDSPIIALSLRFDRIDNLWHNVFHELFHILNNDGYRLDLEPDDETPIDEIDEVEKRANDESADALIPTGVLDSFIRRVSPFYRRERIIQFANRNKIHPGIVIGQLQHRKEISWKSNKEFLVNVRDIIKKTALTDGWGCTIGRSER